MWRIADDACETTLGIRAKTSSVNLRSRFRAISLRGEADTVLREAAAAGYLGGDESAELMGLSTLNPETSNGCFAPITAIQS